ncbi:aldehyde dehydrogenase family protein [Paractinoplanes lichenicola]|uniref:Aldehyde dehydrogenase family protein n=1 Tax=Paractinoplanes lichenicola TaxID=2802976 RepID=A0ABS1W6D7_9ACTN|nr:aldehyde dehydrogenase family protein [Actinoplanes lichenicola]MBL7262253.1 aldehyde dehydrogenase family protein [Actinoplanes lichenicola]
MLQLTPRIGGHPASADDWIEVLSPYDGSAVARVPALGAAHVDAAVAAAVNALDRDDFPQFRRAEVLERAAELLAERVEEFAVTIAREAGKPIRDARDETRHCVGTLRFSAVEARRLAGEVVAMDASASGYGHLGFTIRHPAGVVAAISPFTFPLDLVAHKLGPAVASGCPVVLKPAGRAPVSAIRLVDLLVEAGLPADWISVVTGTGPEAGMPLVSHPGPAVVTFTGSVPVGRRIQQAALGRRVLLELGATAPVIVEPDADLPRAITAIRQGAFSCVSAQRVLVHGSLYRTVLAALIEAARSLRLGDPLAEETEVGPPISPAATERIAHWLQEARDAGVAVAGGEVHGTVMTPAVVADPPQHLDVSRREVLGPVLTVTPYGDLTEAIALAGDAGPQAAIFTAGLGAALRAARELRFESVLINQGPALRTGEQTYAVREMTDRKFVVVSP